MGVMMGPDGQLINTSNISGVGSNLIPNIMPNIGALSQIDDPVTNPDGTITLPKIELTTNNPNLEMGQLQKIYGRAMMPYFNWVERQQIGSTTYDPSDDNSAEELEAIVENIVTETGRTPQDIEAEMQRASQKFAGGLASRAGSAFGSAMSGGAVVEDAFKAGFGAVNPINFLNKNNVPQQAVQAGRGLIATGAGIDGATAANYGGRVINRLNPTSSSGGANLQATGYAAGADFITQVAMGADPMDAAKDAGKTAVLSYVANAIIPGSGPIVGFLSKFF
tara:strand:- start:3488 stop:4324 length:837 start_codon:yes stop_codon:yes gene_type:complete